jgi:hypothetical protein
MEPMSNCQQWKLRTTKLALGVPENRQSHSSDRFFSHLTSHSELLKVNIKTVCLLNLTVS